LANTVGQLGSVSQAEPEAVLLEGIAGAALVAELDRTDPDLLVMATHGRGAFSRLWIGSVADHVVRHTSTPVLLLHPKEGEPVTKEVQFGKGLVLLDRSEEAEAILPVVADFARVHQSHLTLLHVVEPGIGVWSGPEAGFTAPEAELAVQAARDDAQRYLDHVADRLRSEGIRVATKSILGAGIARTVLAQLDAGPFDYLALTTHGVGGVRRVLVGSVADKLIRSAGKPVLVLRPEAEPNFR
jgi:nucleotide-binding universal stress UspA family protein